MVRAVRRSTTLSPRHLAAPALWLICGTGFVLGACGDGGGSDAPTGTGDPVDEGDADAGAVDRIIGTCGSLAVSPTAPSRLLPVAFTVGEVVSGTVDADDLLDSKHRWGTTLETGRYRVVLESRRVDGEIAGIGLDIRSFLDGETDGLRLTDTDEIDRRVRETGVLTIEGPEGASAEFLVEVSPKYGPETYHLAILDEQAVVPVPYFVDCPDIEALALDTTESFSLGTIGADDAERWFSFSQPAGGDYVMSIAASRDTGIASDIGMEINFFDSLGGIQPTIDDERIIDRFAANVLDQIDVFIRESSDSTQQGDPSGYVRLRNVGEELNVELTLNRTGTTP